MCWGTVAVKWLGLLNVEVVIFCFILSKNGSLKGSFLLPCGFAVVANDLLCCQLAVVVDCQLFVCGLRVVFVLPFCHVVCCCLLLEIGGFEVVGFRVVVALAYFVGCCQFH